MAPFKNCTICKKRTRKVVRDPVTKRNKYVCPACFKANKHLKSVNRENLQNDGQEEEIDAPEETSENPEIEGPAENDRNEALENDVPEETSGNPEMETPNGNAQSEALEDDVPELTSGNNEIDIPTGNTQNQAFGDDVPEGASALQNDVPEEASAVTSAEDQENVGQVPTEENNPVENAQPEILPNDVPVMPLTENQNANGTPKAKAPVMELMVINERKYLVVCQTAEYKQLV